MFDFKGMPFQLKIFLILIFSLIVTFIIGKPQKLNFPVLPLTLELNLDVKDDKLVLTKGQIIEGYPADYQTDIQNNFYRIEILKENLILFTGKTPKNSLTFRDGDSANAVSTDLSSNFSLFLPYFKEANSIIIWDEYNKQLINLSIAEINLKIPPNSRSTCGDGICSDDENLILCLSDCLK